ncbi:PAS domain S-box protein [Geobacter pelophilus]|uniref:histidine kinase n=1 Tax=Geoanaerobacter pelophilus TaxID=60036 RepID=A0AAW4LCH6_9BACT|nr:PAS domain-containing sensor histidine kinase [Geoanaerobacter pelophilus]MBT0666111.1 PAS domain S-box protein [Geoanaerobacter pelophilus]
MAAWFVKNGSSPTAFALLVRVIIITISAELTVDLLLPLFLTPVGGTLQVFWDAVCVFLLSTPSIWLLAIRPLLASLRSEKALLDATVQSTADGILAVSWGRKVDLYNKQYVDMLGIPEEILLSADSQKVTFVANKMVDPAAYVKRLDALYSNKEEVSRDLLYLKDGRIIDRYSRPQLIDGVSVGRVWSFRDITDHVRAEEGLRKSVKRFQELAANVPVGIFETDCEGDCIYVNPEWCRIAGIGFEQALGKGWLAALHPDDVAVIKQEWYRSVEGEREFRLEYRFKTPRGEENWVFGSAVALKGEDGSTTGYLGTIVDINERKWSEQALTESEERFRQVFEQSEDAIVLFEVGSCRIIDLNPTAERLYGFSKSELTDLRFNVFKTREDYHKFIHRVCLLEIGETCNMDQVLNLRRDGSEIHVSVRAKVIKLQGEHAVYCTIRDITERLRMEEEARSIQSQLIMTNKMASLGLLVAGIGHEINNPNNYIMANAQMLDKIVHDLEPMLREESKIRGDFFLGGLPYSRLETALPEMVSAINEGSRRIKKIIGSLKDYSRNGKETTERVDLNSVINSAMILLGHHINKYTDHFLLELDEALPAVQGSAQQLEQVAVNLIMNALQSLTVREQRLSIRASYVPEKRMVCMSISDEGCGIPDGVRERVMEPFFTTRLDSGGTGLGLSITQSIVAAHHGEMQISSRPGEGTTVSVLLPVYDSPQLAQ